MKHASTPLMLTLVGALALGTWGCSQSGSGNAPQQPPSSANPTAPGAPSTTGQSQRGNPAMTPATPSTAAQGQSGEVAAGAGAAGAGAAAQPSSDQPGSDTWITTKVKAKLATMQGVQSTDVSVKTVNGVVTLTGVLPSETEVDQVTTATKSIKGVKDVDGSGLKAKG